MEIESLYKIHQQLVAMDRNKPHSDRSSGAGGAIHKSLHHQVIKTFVFRLSLIAQFKFQFKVVRFRVLIATYSVNYFTILLV